MGWKLKLWLFTDIGWLMVWQMYEMIWDVWDEAACWLGMNIYILTYLYLYKGQLWGSYAISKQSIYKYLSINKLSYNNIVSYLPLEKGKIPYVYMLELSP